jgi:hypothetical protein
LRTEVTADKATKGVRSLKRRSAACGIAERSAFGCDGVGKSRAHHGEGRKDGDEAIDWLEVELLGEGERSVELKGGRLERAYRADRSNIADSKEADMQESEEEESDPRMVGVELSRPLLTWRFAFHQLELEDHPDDECRTESGEEERLIREGEDDERRCEGEEEDEEALEEGLSSGTAVNDGYSE